jgi:hypothetical protein
MSTISSTVAPREAIAGGPLAMAVTPASER